MAAGYSLPAGIEAHLLHYATEMRRQGFDTRVVVFYPLPAVKHRYLAALEERRIPIRSLFDLTRRQARFRTAVLWLPWLGYMALRRGTIPSVRRFLRWTESRCAAERLADRVRREPPDVVHVFGRLPHNAWPVFPPERTIYHHMMMGTVDAYWTAEEVEAFRAFAHRVARVFAPGDGVARTLAREFRIGRPIESVFTMAPDEGQAVAQRKLTAAGSRSGANLRFGILCRFTEQKGIAHILEALRQFRERHGDVHFLFAGQGPREDTIREFATTQRLPNVRVAPVHTPAETLDAIDVFVHPGLDDAMPVSLVEALMCGCPCITTDVGGCPDLVRDGQEGFVIEPARADRILEAMERFAAMSADELAAFRRRARARYEERCTPASIGAVVAEQYRAILKVTAA